MSTLALAITILVILIFLMKRIDHKQRETLNQLWKMENYIERFVREELQRCRQQQG